MTRRQEAKEGRSDEKLARGKCEAIEQVHRVEHKRGQGEERREEEERRRTRSAAGRDETLLPSPVQPASHSLIAQMQIQDLWVRRDPIAVRPLAGKVLWHRRRTVPRPKQTARVGCLIKVSRIHGGRAEPTGKERRKEGDETMEEP
jgi:hypothetical protein